MRLYYFDAMNPRKACAVARLLGLPVEFVHLDVTRGGQRTPAFLALNPNAKLPVLVDGDTVIWESNAIMCHLAVRAGSDLWPRDAARQVEAVRWFSWNAEHFSRATGALYFEGVIKPRYGIGPADAAVVAEATAQFRIFAAVLDLHLQQLAYLLGAALSVADFAVAAALPYAEPAGIPLAEFPAVARWHDRLMALPAWREPYPDTCDIVTKT